MSTDIAVFKQLRALFFTTLQYLISSCYKLNKNYLIVAMKTKEDIVNQDCSATYQHLEQLQFQQLEMCSTKEFSTIVTT